MSFTYPTTIQLTSGGISWADNIITKHSDTMASIKENILQKMELIAVLQEELEERKDTIRDLAAERDWKNVRIAELEKECERKQNEVCTRDDIITSYKTTLATLKDVEETNKTLRRQLSIVQSQLSRAESESAHYQNQFMNYDRQMWDELYHISERETEIVHHTMEFNRMKKKMAKLEAQDKERREQVDDLVQQLNKSHEAIKLREDANLRFIETNVQFLQTICSMKNEVNDARKRAHVVADKEQIINALSREVHVARLQTQKTIRQMENERNKHVLYVDELERQYNLFLKEIEATANDTHRVDILEHTITQINEHHAEEKKNIFAQLQMATQTHAEKLAEKDAQIAKLTDTLCKYNALFNKALSKPDLTQSAMN